MAAKSKSLLPHAIEYTTRGWRVHPVKKDKTPILKAWQDRATTDEEKAQAMWNDHPTAGIGIACGRESNLVVIDIDPRHNGNEGLATLVSRYGPLPQTVTVKTGGGGTQLYFAHPGTGKIRNKAKLDKVDGVDVRGDGGYVVAPPSLHPSGNQYEWAGDTENVADLPEAWAKLLTAEEPIAAEPVPNGQRGKLRTLTMQFIAEGCGEGERNDRLYRAATELAGAGYSIEEARTKLWLGAQACKPPIERMEFEAALTSAYGKPRTPWVDPNDVELVQRDGGAGTSNQKPGEPANGVAGRRSSVAPASMPSVSNIQVIQGREGEPKTLARDIVDIAANIVEASGGFPKLCGAEIFALNDYNENEIPSDKSVRFMKTHAEFFAWVRTFSDLNWPTRINKGTHSPRPTGGSVTAVSRQEMLDHLKATTRPVFHAIECLPHVPEIETTFYVPFNLPVGNGDCLREWVDRFNGDEEIDFDLFLASVLTPAWGGPCGARPPFIFDNVRGERGSGKTKTVERLCDIYGRRITIDPDAEDWATARARLLDSIDVRCVLIDNVKKKLSGASLESMMTSPTIDGKKMYVGQAWRPNRLTFFVTANTPSLGEDIADRSVIIHVGSPVHGNDWEPWALRFIEDNRLQLLSDIYTALRGPTVCRIEPENRDRWSLWQDAILARIETGNECAAFIKARRGAVNTDREDAEDIVHALREEAVACGNNPDAENIRIPVDRLCDALRQRGLVDRNMGKRAILTYLSNLTSSGSALSALVRDSGRRWGRCFVLVAPTLTIDARTELLKDSPTPRTERTQGGRY